MIRKKQIHLFYIGLIWIFMWILSGWNTDNADLSNYVTYYDEGDMFLLSGLANPGFHFLNYIFNSYNISFETYHIILFGIITFFICYQVWKRSYNPIIVILIYLLTAYIPDIIQLKNSLAYIFLLLGLFCLIDPNERHSKLKFLILNTIATTIHVGFVFYFVFLLVDRKIKSSYVICGSILLSIFGHSILSYFSSFAFISDNTFLNNRAESYLSTSSYVSVILCSLQYLLHYYVCKSCVLNSPYNGINKHRFMQITALASTLIIMTSVNMTFFRLFRNLLLFSSIYIINGYYYKSNKMNMTCILFLYFITMSYFHLWHGDVLKNVGIIINNNSFW